MADKLIRTSLQTWQTLRTEAFHRNTHIKTVMDELISEKFGPIEIEVE